MNNLKVILVDDHQLFREGLKLLLGNFKYIVSIKEASNGQDFLEMLKEDRPDIVFMDINMPGVDGIEATRLALQSEPSLNIIGLSMYADEDYYTRMIDAGAKGFVLKNSSIHEVETAIKHILNGNNYFSPEILTGLVRSINRKKTTVHHDELSERELEVLYQICKGLSNQEIADKLHISKRTVDKHRENLLAKTNSKNTVGLVMFAIKNKIVGID